MTEASRGTWHRAVWQRLPRRFRRAALFRVASMIAPRINQDAPLALPLIVVGSLNTASGLGQSARLCHDALQTLGLPTYGIDIGPGLMQPDDGVRFIHADGRGLTGPGTLIFHVNGPLMALAMLALPRELLRGKRIVAYWAWELPSLPADWRAGFACVHEIWVPSRFTAEAVAAQAGSIPVHVVPHPVAMHYAVPGRKPRDAQTPFTALAIFNMASSFARKNPIAAITAFRMAFGNDPTCTAHCQMLEHGSLSQRRGRTSPCRDERRQHNAP